jgi:hypothetical protein
MMIHQITPPYPETQAPINRISQPIFKEKAILRRKREREKEGG